MSKVRIVPNRKNYWHMYDIDRLLRVPKEN